jgi:hypothetical protein
MPMNTDNYYLAVWDVQFYLVDKDQNCVHNEDGTVKLFSADFDCSYLAENLTVDDLVEVK